MKSYTILATAGVLAIAACGGGGQQSAGIDGRGNPTPTVAVVSRGTVTGFGSIIVNGLTFDTDVATFGIDGRGGTQADLSVGHVVTVQGVIDEDGTAPVANVVTFDDVVEGPISAIDPAAQTLTVLGQLIQVDADTSFDDDISPASLDGLNLTDTIEVSGFRRADGSVSATRIERRLAAGELEVTGTISNLAGTSFDINGFVVDFSAAMLQDFPGGSPENGQLVEAKGDSLGGSGELLATQLEYKGGNLGTDGDRAELEGFVTRFTSATDFDVENVPVTTNAQTVFENGSAADLALNRKVEVEGDINAAGVLVASKVEIKLSGFIRAESLVEDVQADQLTVLGIVIQVNAATRFEDKSIEEREPFNLSHVVVGNFVEIRGYEDASGIIATRLERDDDDGEVALRGFVTDVNEPEITILDVVVSTTGASFFDLDGSPLSSTEFFQLANGRLVEASGTLNGSVIVASEVEFED